MFIVSSALFFYFLRVLLTPSQSHRYLHSSVILNGMMLVFGGNTHNGTSYSNGGQCFSADFQAYDIGMATK